MLYYLVVALLGASVSLTIALVGRSNVPLLAGILPLFPTFTMLTYILHHYNYKMENMGQLSVVSIVSAACIIGFNLAFYFLHAHIGFWNAIFASLVVWVMVAYGVYHFYIRL